MYACMFRMLGPRRGLAINQSNYYELCNVLIVQLAHETPPQIVTCVYPLRANGVFVQWSAI